MGFPRQVLGSLKGDTGPHKARYFGLCGFPMGL